MLPDSKELEDPLGHLGPPGPQEPARDKASDKPAPEGPAPLGEVQLHGYQPDSRHRLMDPELAGNIRLLLPPRLQLYDDWHLLYSFEQHGISLNTLYRHCSAEHQLAQHKPRLGYAASVVSSALGTSGLPPGSSLRKRGYVLVVQDEHRNKFGCFLNERLRKVEHKRYYGNGECFLWKCEYFNSALRQGLPSDPQASQRFKAFMYTGVNDNIIYSNNNYIAVGSSSGNNGLWLDKSLSLGVSYACDTFGNEVLNEHGETGNKFGKFKIMALELWRVGTPG